MIVCFSREQLSARKIARKPVDKIRDFIVRSREKTPRRVRRFRALMFHLFDNDKFLPNKYKKSTYQKYIRISIYRETRLFESCSSMVCGDGVHVAETASQLSRKVAKKIFLGVLPRGADVPDDARCSEAVLSAGKIDFYDNLRSR